MSARRRRTFRLTRDLVSYVIGIAGIIWETAHRGTERPSLLLAFLAMLALPKVIGRDENAGQPPPPPAEKLPEGETPES